MKRFLASLGFFACLAPAAVSADDGEIFSPGDHCVAYRTVKDLLFAVDAEITGRNCEVSAALVASEGGAGPRVVVSVPIKRFKSRNILRDRKVAELLGAKTQPELRFTSDPIDAEAVRAELAEGSLYVSGVLTIGGKDFPLEFPLEVVEREGGHTVKGRLPTTFAAFEVEVPTVAGGLIARPHEELELVVHLDPRRIEGLEDWAREQGLR
jgi:polyisoprenoid-binding protein YceI